MRASRPEEVGSQFPSARGSSKQQSRADPGAGQRANPGRKSQFSSCLWRFGYTRPGSPGRLRGIHPPKDLNIFDGALHPGVRGSAWLKIRPGRSSTENPSSLVAVSRPEFCGVWFSWFWWFSVVTVSGSPGWCREPKRLRAQRECACR